MRIIEDPSREDLQKLQDILEKNRQEGIHDIWAVISPWYLAMEHDGVIVGVISVSFYGNEAAEIYKIYVHPAYRRNGVARALFREALRRFCRLGIKQVFFEASSEAGLRFLQSETAGMKVDRNGYDKYIILLDCKIVYTWDTGAIADLNVIESAFCKRLLLSIGKRNEWRNSCDLDRCATQG